VLLDGADIVLVALAGTPAPANTKDEHPSAAATKTERLRALFIAYFHLVEKTVLSILRQSCTRA
jgi:hypothetical protein